MHISTHQRLPPENIRLEQLQLLYDVLRDDSRLYLTDKLRHEKHTCRGIPLTLILEGVHKDLKPDTIDYYISTSFAGRVYSHIVVSNIKIPDKLQKAGYTPNIIIQQSKRYYTAVFLVPRLYDNNVQFRMCEEIQNRLNNDFGAGFDLSHFPAPGYYNHHFHDKDGNSFLVRIVQCSIPLCRKLMTDFDLVDEIKTINEDDLTPLPGHVFEEDKKEEVPDFTEIQHTAPVFEDDEFDTFGAPPPPKAAPETKMETETETEEMFVFDEGGPFLFERPMRLMVADYESILTWVIWEGNGCKPEEYPLDPRKPHEIVPLEQIEAEAKYWRERLKSPIFDSEKS